MLSAPTAAPERSPRLLAAITLFVLFIIQLPFQQPAVRYALSALYSLLALVFFVIYGRHLISHLRVTLLRAPAPPDDGGQAAP